MSELKSSQFVMRLAPDEKAMLSDLADADGLKLADVVRLLVRREHAARFGDAKATTKKPPKR